MIDHKSNSSNFHYNKSNDLIYNITNFALNTTSALTTKKIQPYNYANFYSFNTTTSQQQQQQFVANSNNNNKNEFNFIATLAELSGQTTPNTSNSSSSNINVDGFINSFDNYASNLSFINNGTTTQNFEFVDCPDFYNPSSDYVRFEFWVCGIVLNVVGLLGILGNILSMVILSRPQMRSSINYLLIGLARCDTILIITSMLLFGIPSIYPYTGYLYYYYYYIYPNISPCLYPIAMASQTASVYMTFTVTLERYVAVCHPLRARAICTYGRAKIYFIICTIFACLYNIPRFLEVVVITDRLRETNGNGGFAGDVIFCVVASKIRRNEIYINIYIHWCYLVFIYIIPFLSLAILNCLIYRQVQLANRERQRLTRTERREISLATMLLCVVIVFFLLNFLALYTNILEAFYNIINDYLVKISNLLVTLNSSVNFIIYVIFGEKFKRIFLSLFCKGKMNREAPDLIHYESSLSNGDGGPVTATTHHRSSSERFSRHGTQRSATSRNGISTSVRKPSQTSNHLKRHRAPSPGPCVYYPARHSVTKTLLDNSANNLIDGYVKNGVNAVVNDVGILDGSCGDKMTSGL